MIKKYGSFVAGMAAMLLVASLVGSVFAASSRVEYNQAGISLFGEDKVLAGETCKAPNGQGVPSVIIYVDVAEDKTNYLSIRQISKLLGIEVRRDSQKNRVNLGAAPADYVVVGGKRGDGSIPANATTPVLGGVHGPFTEIDPVKAAGKSLSGIIQDNTKLQTTCCYSLTVTNNGSAMQTATAGRTLTLGGFESGHWRGRNAGQNLLYRRQCGGIGEYTGLRHLCQGSFQSQRYYSFSETV